MLTNGYCKNLKRYAICYSLNVSTRSLKPFNMAILDPNAKVDMLLLKDQRKSLYAYLSVGEVNSNRWYFEKLRKSNLLFDKESKVWKGSYKIDVRSKVWQAFVISTIIPSILHKGYTGIFLDTVDTPIEMERGNPEKNKGMKKAVINLIKAIRYHYPYIKIIMNRGYTIIPDVVKSLDGILGESLYTTYDFEQKIYKPVELELYQKRLSLLQGVKKRNPRVVIYSLDYWDEQDIKKIKQIYETEVKNGFIPYVSTISLDKVLKEPNENK